MEEYEISLGDYIRVLWQEKWVVIFTFIAAVALALIVSFTTPRQYQVQTALLILPPLYQDIGGQLTGPILSPESYKKLALAGDLLEKTIQRAELDQTAFTPSKLQSLMKVEVEVEQLQGTSETTLFRFPVYLRVLFAGPDPKPLVRLAQAWGQSFLERYSEVFTSWAAQRIEYFNSALIELGRDLQAKQKELALYLQANTETLIQAEVDALQAKYIDYLRFIADTETQLAAVEARIKALKEALAQEPEYFVLVRAPSDEALWQFLGTYPEARDLTAYTEIKLADQVLNSTYVSLRHALALAQAEFASLQASVAYYREALARISEELAAKQAKLLEIKTKREQLELEIAVLKDSYNRVAKSLQEAKIARAETPEPIRIVEQPVLPTIPVGPSRKLAVAVAGVLGLFVGVLLAFVVHYFREEKKEPGETQVSQEKS